MSSFQVLSAEGLESIKSDRRCVMIKELLASNAEVVFRTVRHAVAFTNGLIADISGRCWSYSTEWLRGVVENGVLYLIDCTTGKNVWSIEDGLDALVNIEGIKLESGAGIRFKGEFTPHEPSVLIGKHVIMLALFNEGVAVFLALGQKGRKGMIRRLDRHKFNNGLNNLQLRVFKKYLREQYPYDFLEIHSPGSAESWFKAKFCLCISL